jgi:PAS domain S-box-containing protein
MMSVRRFGKSTSGLLVRPHTGYQRTRSNSLPRPAKSSKPGGPHYAAIVESSDDAIITKNLEGIIWSWNPAAHRIFGYTEEEAIGQPITIVPSDLRDEENEILRRVRAGQRVDHYETRRVSKDGRTIDVSITVSPIRNAEGQVIGASKIPWVSGSSLRILHRSFRPVQGGD